VPGGGAYRGFPRVCCRLPEPDVALVRPRADEDATAHPTAEAVLLVVEVSDSTLLTDRRVKRPRYAAAGLPEVWLLDLQHDRLEVSRAPRGERYAVSRAYRPPERLAPLDFPDLELTVAAPLPPGAAERDRERARERRRSRQRGGESER
jgi:Uma2 family endonuclease